MTFEELMKDLLKIRNSFSENVDNLKTKNTARSIAKLESLMADIGLNKEDDIEEVLASIFEETILSRPSGLLNFNPNE